MPVEPGNNTGTGFIDYLLLGKDAKPLAIVEAKRTMYSSEKGLQQARLYARCLRAEFGYEPPIFLTNGFETFFVDDEAAPMRRVSGIFSRGELATILGRRGKQPSLSAVSINTGIAGDAKHYYQAMAIRSVCNNIEAGNRRSLLVISYVEANGYMEPDALTKAPFDRPQSFVRLFDRRRQMRLVSIIRAVRDNALNPAA